MKRFIAILLVIATLFSMSSCLASCGSTAVYLTRGEWIMELADRFGMDGSIAESDYFSDVNETSPYYNYVQSCADWEIVSNQESDKFKPDEDATVEFALETAIIASEVDIGEQSVVDYAIANGIIKDAGFMSVRGRLTPEIAQQIIDWTQNLYLNGVLEPREIVEYNPEVQNLTAEEAIEEVEEGVYNIPADLAETLQEGDVLVMPDSEYSTGMGVKVDEITENEDGTVTVTTLEPELEELLENLDVAGPVTWTMDDVQLAEGVSLGGAGGISHTGEDGVYVSNLVYTAAEEPQVTNLANGIIPDINLNVNFTKGTVGVSPQWDSLFGLCESFSLSASESQYATDPDRGGLEPGQFFKDKVSIIPVGSAYGNDAYKSKLAVTAYQEGKISLDELKKELNLSANQEEKNPKRMENKFAGGYEITGNLKISNIKLDIEAKYKLTKGLKASINLGYNVTSTLAIKGELSESLNFMTVRVPVGATGFTVDVKFYLCLDANGELSVSATLGNNVKYSMDYGKIKRTSTQTSNVSGTFSCEIDFGPKIALEVTLVGQPIVDFSVKAVARAKGEATLGMETTYTSEAELTGPEVLTINYKTYWKVSVNVYVPIITFEVNQNPKSIGNKLKLSAKLTLIGEEKAKQLVGWESGQQLIWSGTETIGEIPEEETEPTEVTEPLEEHTNYGDFLDIDSYFLSMNEGEQASIAITIIPKGYSTSDLMWTSSDTSVASVSGGVVTAHGSGVATITVRTTDGQFYKQCGIVVAGSDDGFTPLDDNMGKIT